MEKNNLNDTQKGIMELINYAPLENVKTVLDIGMDDGFISKFLSKQGKKVTGTSYSLEHDNINIKKLKRDFDISVKEDNIEDLPFSGEIFDCVILSHVLEHCPNVSLALKEIHRVLIKKGYLFVFVPEHRDMVNAGHVSMGWDGM